MFLSQGEIQNQGDTLWQPELWNWWHNAHSPQQNQDTAHDWYCHVETEI